MSTPGDFQVGSTITDGSRAIRLTHRSSKSARWETQGWHGVHIAILHGLSSDTGAPDFVPDYLLDSWRHVPFEWSPRAGGVLEERYVWTSDCWRLRYETRLVSCP